MVDVNASIATAKAIAAKKREEAKKQEKIRELLNLGARLAEKTGFAEIARVLNDEQPIFFDSSLIWWAWNKKRHVWEPIDETDVLLAAKQCLSLQGDATIKNRNNLLEAIRLEARAQKPQEPSCEWIQFGTTFHNIQTGKTMPSLSSHFSTNAIPWEPGDSEETPTLDRLFGEWVGEKHRVTLYELIAYCCYREYPIHLLFVLDGNGRNGKSTFLRLLTHFLGKENIASSDLETICDNRFETYNLYRKLVALMGETDMGLLKRTGRIKQLTGQDPIRYEPKGKRSITEESYAKLIIATNSLPHSTDTSDGYYRRWFIIDFPNEFAEGKNPLGSIPEQEYNNLARKVLRILRYLIPRETFTHQGEIEERKERYIRASNPLQTFIDQYCVTKDTESYELYSTLSTKYAKWLHQKRRKPFNRRVFGDTLKDMGYETRRTTMGQQYGTYVFGLKLKTSPLEYEEEKASVREVRQMRPPSLHPIRVRTELEQAHYTHLTHSGPEKAVSVTASIRELLINCGGQMSTEQIERAVGVGNIENDLAELKRLGDVHEPRSGWWEAL